MEFSVKKPQNSYEIVSLGHMLLGFILFFHIDNKLEVPQKLLGIIRHDTWCLRGNLFRGTLFELFYEVACLSVALTDTITNFLSERQGNTQFCSAVLKMNRAFLVKAGELQTYKTRVAIRDLWLE